MPICRIFSSAWSRNECLEPVHACRETSRVPASARQSQNVPVSYPRRVEISPLRATQHAHVQGFCGSPLTDSNRRPPLTMRLRRQAVAAGGKEIRLVEAVPGLETTEPFASHCPSFFHNLSILSATA